MSRKTFVSPGIGIRGKTKPEMLSLLQKYSRLPFGSFASKTMSNFFFWFLLNNHEIFCHKFTLLLLHRTKLDRKYRMETLHTLEAVFCDPCKNQVRDLPSSAFLKSGTVPFPEQRSLVGSAQDSSCWWRRKGRHCELWSSPKRKGCPRKIVIPTLLLKVPPLDTKRPTTT